MKRDYVVAPGKGSENRVILGMVYNVDHSDPRKIRLRRPHVGYFAGRGKLIWITNAEVFFEEALPADKSEPDRYAITGFRYTLKAGRLSVVGKAFQAVYSRKADQRPPWFQFPVDLAVPKSGLDPISLPITVGLVSRFRRQASDCRSTSYFDPACRIDASKDAGTCGLMYEGWGAPIILPNAHPTGC